jgi:hypothetical protein
MVCADETAPAFVVIENFCLYYFTIEYGLRFISCWAVSPRYDLIGFESQLLTILGFLN